MAATPRLILSAMNKLPSGGEVILALDNDNGGVQLAAKISTLFGQIDAGGCVLKTDLPPNPGQDWNDVLQA
ncbi:MAG TPA: toprim domain-containing protein [Terrimicrobiaceae bacterium]